MRKINIKTIEIIGAAVTVLRSPYSGEIEKTKYFIVGVCDTTAE